MTLLSRLIRLQCEQQPLYTRDSPSVLPADSWSVIYSEDILVGHFLDYPKVAPEPTPSQLVQPVSTSTIPQSYMKHKFLLISVNRPPEQLTQSRSPACINLGLELDKRMVRAQHKGYLSSRLSCPKPQLNPVQSSRLDDNIKDRKVSSYVRRTSLQLLPKLHQYEFPFEQIPEKDPLFSTCRPHLKISPMRTQHDFKGRKSNLNREINADNIDNILFRMIEEDDIVHNRIERDLERELTDEERDKCMTTCRRSVNPRIEGLECQNRKLEGTGLRERIKEKLENKGSLAERYEQAETYSRRNSRKKRLELRGWEAPHIEDFNGF